MACVVLIIAARETSIGCHRDPIAAVDAAAIHEYTENSRYCSLAVRSSSKTPCAASARRYRAIKDASSARRAPTGSDCTK
ncbi:MAG: hypothetical protein QOF66_2061 [Mycobacterium sp.]|jgi:hypothetical protein|nr:hypothetical protein [Mycobacterium sp.]